MLHRHSPIDGYSGHPDRARARGWPAELRAGPNPALSLIVPCRARPRARTTAQARAREPVPCQPEKARPYACTRAARSPSQGVLPLIRCAPTTISSSSSHRLLRDLGSAHPLHARRRIGEDRPPVDGTGAGSCGREIGVAPWRRDDVGHRLGERRAGAEAGARREERGAAG
jgi:hypothetical protein